MRFTLFSIFALILTVSAAHAQSVTDNLPTLQGASVNETAPPAAKEAVPAPQKEAAPPAPQNVAENYTVADVNSDVTADSASHARDKALIQAERTAYSQLCTRLGVPDNSAKLSDDALAAMVKSFELQSEHVSAVRYIGVFTIHFKQSAVQKKAGGSASATETKVMPVGTISHVAVSVHTDSLAAWTQIKHMIESVPPVAKIDIIDLGRGVSHIDLSYVGSIEDLAQVMSTHGLAMQQGSVGWELYQSGATVR